MKDEIKERLKNSLEYEFELSFNDRKQLLDYITNLQEENERLQQSYTDEYNLRHKLSLELSVEKDKVLELSNHLTLYSCEETMLKQIEDYKSRNEKAIEYIKQHQVRISIAGEKELGFCDEFDIFSSPIVLLNILQGVGKDE